MDTSAQKMAQERLVQTHKMEAVGQLTGGVAHDFNNLLTAVMGNLDLLRDHVAGDELAEKYLATAHRASEHGAGLTERLLAFSGHQNLTAERIDINVVTNQFSQLAARTLGEDIHIETQLADDAWPVIVDPGQLENAFLNLALNARDAMPGGGHLRIVTANQVLDETFTASHEDLQPGDYVMIEMSDDGAGMEGETAARAIEPFFTTKDIGQGSGLGLSMAFGFAKQTGGHLDVESAVGEGTFIRLYLPRAPRLDKKQEAKPKGLSAIPTGGETILVVEDQADLRSFVINLLSRLGYRVLEAADGPGAMPLLDAEGGIDMLLTDVVLPSGMSGADLADAYQQRNPGGKVLYTSGYPGDVLSKSGKLPEDVELLRKPYQVMDLAQTVRRVLDS
jgi:nitrogen-specific signal transduction histidine kinase